MILARFTKQGRGGLGLSGDVFVWIILELCSFFYLFVGFSFWYLDFV